jgi:hypothetical protein
MEHGI